MSQTTEIKDPYTGGHQKRLEALADEIVKRIGLSNEKRFHLHRYWTMLKAIIPTDALSKAMPLNEQEREFVRLLPRKSFDLLGGIPFEGQVLTTILQYHEPLDGSGYPEGLAGDDLLVTSKILAVADVVEAMLSDRPSNRRAHDVEDAKDEISSNSGKLYDPNAVKICKELFESGFNFEAEEEWDYSRELSLHKNTENYCKNPLSRVSIS